MATVRQKRKQKSSIKKASRRTKDKQRNPNIHAHPVIAAHWDKSLTLAQNYKNLGLVAKLGTRAGGTERHAETVTEYRAKRDALENTDDTPIDSNDPKDIPQGQAKIIRNPETNEVEQIIYGTKTTEEESHPVSETATVVLGKLQEQGMRAAAHKTDRTQLAREQEWLHALYSKYGEDYEKMMWDRKLNVFQQSAGDLKRRIIKWKKSQPGLISA